ncbi:MAG: fatty acid desaturase [Candidatus Eremiobacterota bacterium]
MQWDDDSWTRHLSPEVREKLIELHHVNRRAAVRIAVYLGLWATAGSLAVLADSPWLRLPAWVLIGFCLHGLGDFMHMCSHGRVFAMGWVDRLAGFLCGLPVFISCSNYRANHLLHHRYLNTERDPDYLYANLPDRGARRFVYYLWFAVGLPIYTVRVTFTGPANAVGWREKLLCVGESLTMWSFHAWLLVWSLQGGWFPLLRDAWLLALPFAVLIANVRGLAEHTMLAHGPGPDPLHGTRTTLSHKLVSFFFNNQNYHLEHHLFPSMPWHNLDAAHELLRPLYEEKEASVAASYLRYVRDAFHYGPDVGLRYRDGQSIAVNT